MNWLAFMLSLRKSLSISSSFKKHPLPSSFSSRTSNELVLFRLDMLSDAIDDHDLVGVGGGPLGPGGGDSRPGGPSPPTTAIVACSRIHKQCICNTQIFYFEKDKLNFSATTTYMIPHLPLYPTPQYPTPQYPTYHNTPPAIIPHP